MVIESVQYVCIFPRHDFSIRFPPFSIPYSSIYTVIAIVFL